MRDEPLDPRSTGRRRGRKVLEDTGRPYWCGSTDDFSIQQEAVIVPDGRTVWIGCGRSPTAKDAPGGHYPAMAQLQVNHINKNVLDNDPVNLEWLCASCHKYKDSQTEKGVSVKGEDEHGYGYLVEVDVGNWNQPCCDTCWMARWPNKVPVKFNEEFRIVETCAFCGDPNNSGIYVRADPSEVPYPAKDEE